MEPGSGGQLKTFMFGNYIRQFGRFQRNARLYLICAALSGISVGIFSVLYNLYLASLGYKTDFIGVLLFVGTVGAGLAIFPAGWCIDRLSSKWVMIWASGVIGVVGMGQVLFRTPIPLFISTFIGGVAGAFLLVVGAPYLAAHSQPEERSHLFSLSIVLSLATSVGGEVLGGLLPTWLRPISALMQPHSLWSNWIFAANIEARTYQLALVIGGIIAFPSFFPLFLMDNDQPRHAFSWRRSVLHTIDASDLLQKRSKRARWYRLRQEINKYYHSLSFATILASPLCTLIIVGFLVALGAGLFIPYFNLYFVKYLGASPALFGVIDSIANLLNAAFLLLAPWFALRLGRVVTIFVSRILGVPILLLISFIPFLPLVAFLYPLRQALTDMANGIFQAFWMEEVSEEQRGLANSCYQASYQVALACGTPIGGVMIARIGFQSVFITAAILYTIAWVLFWLRFGRGNTNFLVSQLESEKTKEVV